jgi:acetolactate synthase-1/2/3 large subunit
MPAPPIGRLQGPVHPSFPIFSRVAHGTRPAEDHPCEYIFGYSGGAAIPIFDALETVKTDMKFILVRHEQGAVHMADGYARATGKPAVVLVTSGPGAGNTVTGLMTAQMDSVPMIVLCGQQVTWMLGKDAFQEADIFNITMPVVKHNYLVKNSNDAAPHRPRGLPHRHHRPPRPGAHRHSRRTSARAPSPAPLTSRWTCPATTRRTSRSIRRRIEAAALSQAKRPVILAGQGP